MRQKKPLEIVVSKYMLFLTDIRDYGEDFPACYISQLIEDYKINKSVTLAMRELAIIDYEKDNLWHWLQGDVTRELVLTILNYLLERSKKAKATVIAGLEETNAVLRSLSEKVTEYIQRRENGFKQPQTHVTNGNSSQIHSKNDYYSLFSEVDTKTDLINKAAFSIATGVYEKYGLSKDHNIYDISERNERIVFSAKDLVNQLLK